jgi:hypothetical protein
LHWPAKRVEGIYKAIVTREAVQSMEDQRRDMIAACYANPNWDGKDNAQKREDYLKDINRHFNDAITAIYYPEGQREQEIDWSNPFFAAHRREMLRTKELFEEATGKTLGDVIEDEKQDDSGVDQQGNGRANGRARGKDYDQMPDPDEIPRNT